MSKNIELKQQKIKELSEELAIVNSRIDSYINYFGSLNNTDFGNDITFQLNVSSFNTIDNDKKLFLKNFNLYFTIGNEGFRLLFDDTKIRFIQQYDASFNLILEISKIISYIDSVFGIQSIKNDIESSRSLYSQIENLYKEYNNITSGFTDNSTILISYLKKMVKEQFAEDDGESFYFSFKRDNRRENLEILIKSYYDPNFFQLSLPTFDCIKNKYLEKYSNSQFMSVFEIIFKNEFFLMNQSFFEQFDISLKDIKYSNYYVKTLNDSNEYRRSIIAGLSISSIGKSRVKLLAEKVHINQQMTNF